MKKRIISAVLVVCSVLCMSLYQGTFAWFRTEGVDVNSITFTVADISIEVEYVNPFGSGGAKEGKYLLPGDTVLSDVKVINYSDIISDIRVKAEISVKDDSKVDIFDANDFEIKWSDDYFDGTYYNIGELPANEDADVGTSIDILDSIVCKSSCDNSYSNADLDITLIFQAKQHDGVTWVTLGSLNVFDN